MFTIILNDDYLAFATDKISTRTNFFFQSKYEHFERHRRVDRGPLLLDVRAQRPHGQGRQAHEAGRHSRRI